MERSQVVKAFTEGRKASAGTLQTDGHTLYLHGNPIAWRPPTGHGVCVTLAGWNTVTTRKYLNHLPGVWVTTEKGRPYVNGIPMEDNEVVTVRAKGYRKPKGKLGTAWNLSSVWVSTDGWRGYSEPVCAVAGANDTGMWSDSPCRSDVAARELDLVRTALKSAGIPWRDKVEQSSNVFCVHRYVIVRPCDLERAKGIVGELMEQEDTRLLYAV